MNTVTTEIDFRSAFRGNFVGVLEWKQLDELWVSIQRASNNSGWYVYAIGEPVPESTVRADELKHFIEEMDALLHKEHDENYCGIVYTDSKESPTLVKIFDPNNLGVVCGFSDNPPLPGWVLSRIPPSPLEDLTPRPANRIRWWNKLWHK